MAYSIKSVSEEGEYFLVPYSKHRALWVKRGCLPCILFKSAQGAQASLAHLLDVMPEYKNDVFTLVAVSFGEIRELRTITFE